MHRNSFPSALESSTESRLSRDSLCGSKNVISLRQLSRSFTPLHKNQSATNVRPNLSSDFSPSSPSGELFEGLSGVSVFGGNRSPILFPNSAKHPRLMQESRNSATGSSIFQRPPTRSPVSPQTSIPMTRLAVGSRPLVDLHRNTETDAAKESPSEKASPRRRTHSKTSRIAPSRGASAAPGRKKENTAGIASQPRSAVRTSRSTAQTLAVLPRRASKRRSTTKSCAPQTQMTPRISSAASRERKNGPSSFSDLQQLQALKAQRRREFYAWNEKLGKEYNEEGIAGAV